MRFTIPESAGDSDEFQGTIERMAKAGWIEGVIEAEAGVGVKWTELGNARTKELYALVRPLTDWFKDRSQPKPSAACQIECLLRLMPFVQELGPPELDESESLKLVAFVALLAPK